MMITKFRGKMMRWQIGARLATRKRRRRCAEIGHKLEESL
jgi:hypothetical protein